MTLPHKVVLDCNVYFQAIISLSGPANRLLSFIFDGGASLFSSAVLMDELSNLLADVRVKQKYRLDQAKIDDFLAAVRKHATLVDVIPHVFDLPRDPNDAHYVDLAVAVNARLIVSRDKDLLSLRDTSTPDGRDFVARFPSLEILTPPQALKLLDPKPHS